MSEQIFRITDLIYYTGITFWLKVDHRLADTHFKIFVEYTYQLPCQKFHLFAFH